MGPPRRRGPVEIVVTVTPVAPGTERALRTIQEARRIWMDAQLEAMGERMEGIPTAQSDLAPPVAVPVRERTAEVGS